MKNIFYMSVVGFSGLVAAVQAAGYTSEYQGPTTSGSAGYVTEYQGPTQPAATTTDAAATTTDTAATDTAKTTDATTTDATKTTDTATDTTESEACKEAKKLEAESGTEAHVQLVEDKCTKKAVDVATSTPKATMGRDSADGANYNPPANPKIGKTELSWAKIESFNQLAKTAVDKDGNPLNLSDSAIAGIAGNLQTESRAFQLNQWDSNGKLLTQYGSSAVGDNGTSFGIAQYHNERATDMANYVGADSISPQGLAGTTNAQYNYLFQDIKGQMSSSSYNTLLSSDVTTEQATQIFVSKYERPATDSSQAFGLAGGTSRLSNANLFESVASSDAVTDGSSWTTYTAPKNQNTGYSSTSNLVSSVTSSSSGSSGSVSSIVSNLLGTSGSTSSNVLSSLISSNGTVNTSSLVQIATSAAVSSLLSGSSSSSSGTTSSGTTTTTTTTSTSSSRGYELAKACGVNLPSSTDALMLMIETCKTVLSGSSS